MSLKTSLPAFAVLLFAVFAAGMNPGDTARQFAVTVTAGAYDRMGTVVSFSFPVEVEPGVYTMESEAGNPVYLQVDDSNRGWFILEELEAGASRTYSLDIESQSDPPAGFPGITSSVDHNTITFMSGNSAILSYYHDKNELPTGMEKIYSRGGYIHPAYSPGGVPLTNHLDDDAHAHHYGIWSAWTNTGFQGRTPDFWNVHRHTGRVNLVDSLEAAWTGPVHGGVEAVNHFVDLSGSAPVIALNEKWEVIVYNIPADRNYHMFDLVLTQTANTAQPLVLPEYHYGGMAIRGNGNWNNPDNVSFLTSEGYDRSNGNETRARWCHIGGIVNGERAGIAVLSHPENYRAPQPVRIHPDIPYFVYAPIQLGEMSVEPGFPYVMRYRYITYDGEPDPEKLNHLWNDYAYPPGVTVVAQ